MGEYRHRTTGETKTQGEWRRAHPNTSFPRVWSQEVLDSLELDAVLASPKPTAGAYETVRKNAAVQDAKGNWVESWEVVPMFSEYTDEDGITHTVAEQQAAYQARLDADAAKSVRTKRDSLLAETDWVVVMHTEKGTNIPLDWEVYRQALRDITNHVNFPYLAEDDWPVKPQ